MKKSVFTLLLVFYCFFAQSQSLNDFQVVNVGTWVFPMGTTFDAKGRMYVWERAGKVYVYENDVKTLLLDITEEVANYGDFGLMGLTLDPDFLNNGNIYLFYVVDRYYLFNYGTANYSSGQSEEGASIARITRYNVNTSTFKSVDPSSRTILVGETKSTGFPICGIYHPGGGIKFGTDGTLLASFGDNTIYASYEDQAVFDNILTAEEYAVQGSWRIQMKNSLCGKIIRIDPKTGNGIPSNPYYLSSNPRAPQSRVWALGFRNPFRFTVKPNSGSTNPTDGKPGILFVGDVGQDTKEEINVVSAAGQNFGWPRFEGINSIYAESNDTTYYPQNPRPPAIEWGRKESARVTVNSSIYDVGGAQFTSENFIGGCSIGGEFYTGTKYPEEFRNKFYFADFNKQWFRSVGFDPNNNPQNITNFIGPLVGLINLSYNPVDECFYYSSITNVVARIEYKQNGNKIPTANFTYTPNYGAGPLTVNFDGSSSVDPEGVALKFSWDFGDGTSSSDSKPTHIYTNSDGKPQKFTVTLTVTDNANQTSKLVNTVSINDTPPVIVSTSIDKQTKFFGVANESINLNATVTDKEESESTLKYRWQVFLHHNDHEHPELDVYQSSTDFIMNAVECNQNVYYYRFVLTVTDSYGLSTVYNKTIYPDCIPVALSATQQQATSFQANWKIFGNNTPTYKIDVATDENFNNILSNYNNLTVQDTTKVISGLSPNTTYYYRVRGIGTNAFSSYSNTISAKTGDYLLISQTITNPTALIKNLPADIKSVVTNKTASTYNGYFMLSIFDNTNKNIENLVTAKLLKLEFNQSDTLQKHFDALSYLPGNYTLKTLYSATQTGPFSVLNAAPIVVNDILAIEQENKDDNKIDGFPNPTIDQITFNLKDLNVKNATLSVFNSAGILMQQNVLKSSVSPQISLKNYAEGLYIIQLKLEDHRLLSGKVVLKK